LILNRYIIREVSLPMMAICAVLIAIFASYTAAEYLADAVSGLLPVDFVIMLLLLKIAIALEVLLPTTLYLSVVISLGRMYRDSEMVALESCGVGTLKVCKSVFYFAIMVAVLVMILSLYVRPWSFGKVYWLKAQAQSDFDISQMEGGQFYEIESVQLVLFAENVNHRKNRAEQVFVSSRDEQNHQIIFAQKVYQRLDPSGGGKLLLLQNGYMYEFEQNESDGKITEFQNWILRLSPREIIPKRYRRKAASTVHVMQSDNLEDIAELQWRFSTPLSTLLLALLGVLLSRTSPRQGKYAKVMVAFLIFAVYYPMSVVAKNWVEKGTIDPLPGIWAVQVALAVLIVVLAWRQNVIFLRRSA
jgi:lipopolysaccharide export system permease protein